MVVLRGRLHLVVVVGFIEVDFLYQAQLFKHLQAAIDSGHTETGFLFPSLAVDLVSILVPLPLTNNIKD